MNRRTLLSLLASLLLLIVPSIARADLDLFAWSEYVPQEVIDGFSKETGVKVNYETFASNEEMITKFRAGAVKYDVIQPSEYSVESLIKAQKLERLDQSRLPNMKN